jgi:hypothetical protein
MLDATSVRKLRNKSARTGIFLRGYDHGDCVLSEITHCPWCGNPFPPLSGESIPLAQ